jgi:hypothetical protein
LAYRTKSATHTGFEPVISTVTGWRPLQTGPMGRVVFSVAEAPSRFELAQDVLQTSSAPHGLVPIRKSSPGRIRTVDPLFVRQVPSPLGHRTMLLFVERRPWDSNPQVFRPAVFKTASSPIRVTSVSYGSKHRGQESNLRPSATNALRRCPEPDATSNSCYPGSGNANERAMLALTSPSSGKRIRTSIT